MRQGELVPWVCAFIDATHQPGFCDRRRHPGAAYGRGRGRLAGTQSFAVVCHDPDAPLVTPGHYGYVHWVLYNIPGDATGLAEATEEHTQGVSDFGRPGYGGPMPPEGHGMQNYFFWVLALDANLDLEPGLSLWTLLERIEPHVISMNRLVGTYQRG